MSLCFTNMIEICEEPALIGRCARNVGRGVLCSRKIYDDTDYETLAEGLICEQCVDGILSPYVEPQADSMGRVNNKNKVKGNTENLGKAFRNYQTRWKE